MTTFTLYEAKKRRHPTLDEYKRVAQLFDWATRLDFTLYFHDRPIRDGRTERVLKKLVERGFLVSIWYGKCLIYSVNRLNRRGQHKNLERVEHGLGHTAGLVRIYLSDREGTFTSGRHYRKFGFVPEWDVTYPSGRKLLFEFCTRDNMRRVLKGKIERYQAYLATDDQASALFVLDVDRSEVLEFLKRQQPSGRLAFTDYRTFMSVQLGQHLHAPIYFWKDGTPRPLRT